jgi:hypothetical protein
MLLAKRHGGRNVIFGDSRWQGGGFSRQNFRADPE